MLYIVPFHSLYFIYHPSNKYLISIRQLTSAGIAKIKTQPVRIREISLRGRIINLCNILHLITPVQKHRLESTRQVYQEKSTVIVLEYMRKVKVSVPVIRLVKFLYKTG